MLSRKKRDAKFLIFQSLYLIAISILFYKGTDLSLNKVITKENGDTVIAISKLPPKLDDSDTIIRIETLDSLMKNPFIDSTLYTVVTKQTLAEKDKRIADLERIKTPARQTVKTDKDNTYKAGIEGETPKQK